MDHVIGEFLVREFGDAAGVRATKTNEPRALVILETRPSYWLAPVVRNVVRHHPDWDLVVVGPQVVLDHVAIHVPGDFRVIHFDAPSLTQATYSKVLLSNAFWGMFSAEHVLIFQIDTVFVRSVRPEHMEYDYIGAVCGTAHPDDFIINGGLSLRRPKAMREAILRMTPEDLELHEDIAFTRVMRRHPDAFRLPDMDTCHAFAIESTGDPSRAIGLHGTDKYYAPPTLVKQLIRGSPGVVDAWCYNGEPVAALRLEMLYDVVDAFVVCESRWTHAGTRKETLFRDLHAKVFAKYSDKVHWIIVETDTLATSFPRGPWVTPGSEDAWRREAAQRDAIARHPRVLGADVVVLSDSDEIPDPKILKPSFAEVAEIGSAGCYRLEFANLVYSFSWAKPTPWYAAVLVTPASLARMSPTEWRVGMDATTAAPTRVIRNAGWHCCNFYGPEGLVRKLRSFAHREFDTPGTTDADHVLACLATGRDLCGRGGVEDAAPTREYDDIAGRWARLGVLGT